MIQHIARICTFESRRASEMRKLIEKFGGLPTNAPSMREIPLDQQSATLEFADRLFAGEIDILVLMTGVGTRHMADAIATRHSHEKFIAALHEITIVVRGPKPTAVLKEWGVPIHVRTPEPNTWREMLAAMQSELDLSGKHVAVQEYGISNVEFLQSLRDSGADVESVIVYRWDLPEDRPRKLGMRRSFESHYHRAKSVRLAPHALRRSLNAAYGSILRHLLRKWDLLCVGQWSW